VRTLTSVDSTVPSDGRLEIFPTHGNCSFFNVHCPAVLWNYIPGHGAGNSDKNGQESPSADQGQHWSKVEILS
jgi:hypothetical protein